jgi:hypothetical protein
MTFPTAQDLKERPSNIATDDSDRPPEPLEQLHMIARRAHALVEINSALLRYAETGPGGSLTAGASIPRYAELGVMVWRNTRLWMAIVGDVRKEGHSFGAEGKIRLRGLAKLAATCGQRVLTGKATPQLLIEINLGGLANLQEAFSDLLHWTATDVP